MSQEMTRGDAASGLILSSVKEAARVFPGDKDMVILGLGLAYQSVTRSFMAVSQQSLLQILGRTPRQEDKLRTAAAICNSSVDGITSAFDTPEEQMAVLKALKKKIDDTLNHLVANNQSLEDQVATKINDDPKNPLVVDWTEGESKRMIGNTLVYRTYADKVDD